MSDWKSKTLAHWDTINGLAVRRFGNGSMADEAALTVIEELQAGDWKRVRSFTGKSSFATYIRVLTIRLLEDFARKRFGRIRPPLWIQTPRWDLGETVRTSLHETLACCGGC